MAKSLLEMWPSSIVESVCEVLADTSTGLTGGEIGRLLAKLGVPDIDSSNTKRHLYRSRTSRAPLTCRLGKDKSQAQPI